MGLADYALEWRREATRAKVGARQLRLELRRAANNFGFVQEKQKYPRYFDVRLDAWERYGDALSAKLRVAEYKRVEVAVGNVNEISRRFSVLSLDEKERVEVNDWALGQIQLHRDRCGRAYNALARLAQLDQVALDQHTAFKPREPEENGSDDDVPDTDTPRSADDLSPPDEAAPGDAPSAPESQDT